MDDFVDTKYHDGFTVEHQGFAFPFILIFKSCAHFLHIIENKIVQLKTYKKYFSTIYVSILMSCLYIRTNKTFI